MREFINSIKEWYQRYLYSRKLKEFYRYNIRRMRFYPSEYLDQLEKQIESLKNFQVRRIIDHELTPEYHVVYGGVLELVDRLFGSIYSIGYNYLLETHGVFSKNLCRNLSHYYSNGYVVFNSCIQPENFIKLMKCVNREFMHTNKNYRNKVKVLIYKHSLTLFQEFNEEKGIKIAIKNIKYLANKPKLKGSLPNYTKINIFHNTY